MNQNDLVCQCSPAGRSFPEKEGFRGKVDAMKRFYETDHSHRKTTFRIDMSV